MNCILNWMCSHVCVQTKLFNWWWILSGLKVFGKLNFTEVITIDYCSISYFIPLVKYDNPCNNVILYNWNFKNNRWVQSNSQRKETPTILVIKAFTLLAHSTIWCVPQLKQKTKVNCAYNIFGLGKHKCKSTLKKKKVYNLDSLVFKNLIFLFSWQRIITKLLYKIHFIGCIITCLVFLKLHSLLN